MIGVVSIPSDVHWRCVADELRRMGKEPVLLELPRLGADARLAMATGRRCATAWRIAERAVDLERIEAVWYRRVFPAEPTPAPSSQEDRAWARMEWRDATMSAFVTSAARLVNDPRAQQLAEMKPYHLRVAQAVGLRVPDTLVTNDADAVRAFVDAHRGQVIHKPVTSPPHRFVATKRWESVDEPALAWLHLAPTIFQELVSARHELRVTIVGRSIFAAQFEVPPGVTDARTNLDAPFTRHRLPADVEAGLHALMDRLQLQYAAVDLRRRDDGEYVFLELNAQGQFLYVEMKTGMPLVRAMAELLAG